MALPVIWAPRALADLDGIANYIARDSMVYARSVVAKIFAAADNLALFPGMGRAVPELQDRRWRELIVFHYRVIYFVEPDRVSVAAVVHGARSLPNVVRERGGRLL